jgi:threonine/homoserine/homoserine lactone efflux protein
MQWSAYGAFLACAIVLILIPGTDFAVVSKNALAGGRRRGAWTAVGVFAATRVYVEVPLPRTGRRVRGGW